MDDERMKRIETFLATHNASAETLSKARMKQLEKVDEAIQKRLEAAAQARETLKASSINVSVISSDTGISRKTFYNNDLLRLYVEYYATDEEKALAIVESDKLKEKNAELTQQIQGFVLRDITSENLRHENMMLQNEVYNLQKRNDALETQCEQLQAENAELRKQMPARIIDFNPMRS